MRTTIQKAAMLFGVVFLVVFLAGVIPGLTTNYDRITEFSGEGGLVLGIFGANILETLAHLLFGIAGLAMARTASGARAYFLGAGAIYLVLWIYGLLIDLNSSANFLGLNDAANWLHFALGVIMLGVGLTLGRETTETSRPAAA